MGVQKKQKKGTICEDDISTILQRYPVTTVLTLLQELASIKGVKVDWDDLVRNTKTGITNPREYQMLWRHLAYRDELPDNVEEGAKPLDDDSDLEYELEAFPAASNDALTEAAACVKVHKASGFANNSNLENGLIAEAPLMINIPSRNLAGVHPENSRLASFVRGTNITVPVLVQKHPLPMGTSTELVDSTGNSNLVNRKKRQKWSAEEDEELIAAVRKYGESNWQAILRSEFAYDKTPAQLSQRWNIIKKRLPSVGIGSQISEVHLAAQRAVSFALDMHMGDRLKSASLAAANVKTTASNNPVKPAVTESPSSIVCTSSQSQHDFATTSAQRLGTSRLSPKSRLSSKTLQTKPTSVRTPDAMVKAAAVAAGARIMTPLELKKNAIHVVPGGVKSSTGTSNPLNVPHLSSHPNVHFFRRGPTSTPVSTNTPALPGASHAQLGQSQSAKPVGPKVQANPNLASDGYDINNAAEEIGSSANSPRELFHEDGSKLDQPVKEQNGVGKDNVDKEGQASFAADSHTPCINGHDKEVLVVKAVDDWQHVEMEICKDQNGRRKEEDEMRVEGNQPNA